MNVRKRDVRHAWADMLMRHVNFLNWISACISTLVILGLAYEVVNQSEVYNQKNDNQFMCIVLRS